MPTGPIGRKDVLCHLVLFVVHHAIRLPFSARPVSIRPNSPRSTVRICSPGPPGPLYSWARPDRAIGPSGRSSQPGGRIDEERIGEGGESRDGGGPDGPPGRVGSVHGARRRQTAQAKASAAIKGGQPETKPAPPKPKVAVFRLAGDLTELPPDETFSFGASRGTSLRDLLERMKKAERDEDVKAVVFLHEGGSVGSGQAEELRAAMARLRAAGKEIYAHADSLTMREYVLLSGRHPAERRARRPTCGSPGSSARRRTCAACSISSASSPSSSTCGAYKSAAEIFLRERPEPRGRGDAELAPRRHVRRVRSP